jgi:acetyl esterase
MMYFHGGGFVAGDLDTQDNVCRMVCATSGFVVVSVDYRLGPEHKFPAAPEDCYFATCWVANQPELANADRSRIVLFGESAGGNLAAAVCLMARDRKAPKIRHQILAYGALQQLRRCNLGYLDKSDDFSHPYASPLLSENLSDLPSVTIITAECDTMTPFCAEYARRLIDAGVETHYYMYRGMIHGFLGDERLELCHQAIRDLSLMARQSVASNG